MASAKTERSKTLAAGILGAVAVVLSLSVAVTAIRAQLDAQAQELEISPPSQEIAADPGKTVTVKAKIRNRTARTLPMVIRIEDFTAMGDEGQVALTDNGPWSVSQWTTVSPQSFELKQGESREVTATVKIPATGAAGGRYGSIVFSATGKTSGGAAAVSQEVASLFLLKISGPVSEKLSIETFSSAPFLEFGPVPFSLNYKNVGNVHLRPQGLVSITDMFGRKVADVSIDPTNVFPQATRTVKPVWNADWLIGPYAATAIVVTGASSHEQLTARTTFFVFPVRLAAIAILGIAVMYLMRRRLAKAWKALAGK